MIPDHPTEWVITAAAVVAALTVLWKFGGKLGAFVRELKGDLRAIRDTLVGRPAVVDSITREEKLPAVPPLGVRMAHQEKQMALLTEAVTKIAESHHRLETVETRVDGHDDALAEQAEQIRVLRDAQMERVAARIDSAAAWRAVEALAPEQPDAPPNEQQAE